MPERVFFRRGEEVLRVVLERQRLVIGRAGPASAAHLAGQQPVGSREP
jgi:hypothetical protein